MILFVWGRHTSFLFHVHLTTWKCPLRSFGTDCISQCALRNGHPTSRSTYRIHRHAMYLPIIHQHLAGRILNVPFFISNFECAPQKPLFNGTKYRLSNIKGKKTYRKLWGRKVWSQCDLEDNVESFLERDSIKIAKLTCTGASVSRFHRLPLIRDILWNG